VAENVVPLEIRDERALDLEMRPQTMASPEQLLGRAENLRQASHLEQFEPPPRVKQPTDWVLPQDTILESK
jgi:hypothetical protein